MYRNNCKRIVAIIIALSLFIQVGNFNTAVVYAADSVPLLWDESHSLNNKLELQNVETEYKSNEAMFYWDFQENGTYTLDYNLSDLSEVKLKFVKTNDTLDVFYKAYQYTTTGAVVNITEAEATDYAEVDYVTTPLNFQLEEATPNIVDDGGEKAILFEDIDRRQNYSGATFYINGKTMRFKWDNDRLYFLTEGLKAGNITPFRLQHSPAAGVPSPVYEKKVLVNLDHVVKQENIGQDNGKGFEVEPTHYVLNPAGVSLDTIDQTKDEKSGSKPGIDISFRHPKVWDDSQKKFVIESGQIPDLDNLDVSFFLKEYSGLDQAATGFDIKLNSSSGNITGTLIDNQGANSGKQYTYDATTNTYTVKIVGDKDVAASNNQLLWWDQLKGSRIYEAEIYITPKTIDPDGDASNGNIEFTKYIPHGGYAYTYLEYILKRESAHEAYLEVTPYQGINNDVLKYDVYQEKKKDHVDKNLWLTYTHELGSEPYTGKLYIPVDSKDIYSGYYHLIKIRFDGQKSDREIVSQYLYYKATSEDIVPPPVPQIDSISDVKVIPAESGSSLDDPSRITFDLTWDALDKETLEQLLSNGTLYYELLINEQPQNSKTNPFNTIKVFKVFIDPSDGKIKVEEETGDSSGTDEPWNDYAFGYNEEDQSFRMDDIVLKDENGWATIHTVSDDVDIENGIYAITDTAKEYEDIKKLPNVNFFRMRSVYVKDDGAGTKEGAFSDLSLAKSITLSLSEVDLPVPTDLDYENIMTDDNTIRFELSWNVADTRNYDEFMLEPVGEDIDEVEYEVYIAQDKQAINKVNTSKYLDPSNFDYTADASDNVPTIDMGGSVGDLRKGEVIALKITGNKDEFRGREKVMIEGLDSNQVYYVQIVTRIKVNNDDVRQSDLSEMLSLTTLNLEDSVDDDIMPLTPENFEVKEILSSSSIKLAWDINASAIKPEETIGYELIRIEGKELNDQFGSSMDLESIIEDSTKIIGWRIMDETGDGGYKAYEYDETGKSWGEISDRHEVDNGQINFIDDSLNPNKIYFYYVRAIRVEKGAANPVNPEKPASNWAALTYTSAPLEAPINLTQDFTNHSYNENEEAVVYFDVAEPEEADINFIPEIYIYCPDDEDYDEEYREARDYTRLSKSTDGAPSGYVRYYYRIEDLEPGKSYSVKVRIRTDETEPNYSAFTERIVIRTEFDEDDYIRQELLDKYLKYYDSKSEELYKTIYWTLVDGKGELSVKFKGYNTKDELKSIPEKEYIFKGKDYEKVTIYLPNEVIDVLNDDKIKFSLDMEDVMISINPDTLDKAKVKELKEFINEVNHDAKLKDYYIKLVIQAREYNQTVSGTDALSDLLRIQIDVVGSTTSEINLEEKIYGKLNSLIATHRHSVEADLIKELKKAVVDEEELKSIVDEEIEDVKKEHQSYTNSLMKASTKYDFTSLYNVFKPLTLALKTKNDIASLYKRNGSYWLEQETFSNAYSIYADLESLGEYIFAGYNTSDIIDDSVKNAKYINDIIIKYRLTDFFTLAQLSDLEQAVTKYSMYHSIARMLGAPDDAEAVTWLKAKGFEGINSKNLYGSMTKQEAYYVLVQAYAHKAGINIKTINITNWYAIEDMDEINPNYQDMLLRGVASEVLPLEDGYLNPYDVLTIEELFDVLIKIEYRYW